MWQWYCPIVTWGHPRIIPLNEKGYFLRYGIAGLVFTIVKELIKPHDRTIRVDKAIKSDALFVMNLPLKKDCETRRQVRAKRYINAFLGKELVMPMPFSQIPVILVVEDNPGMNTFLVKTLAKHYRVSSAFDGEEGLEKALLLRPDLIIYSETMPRMNGDPMVRELRRHWGGNEVPPVVMLTDKTDDELKVSLLKESIQDYLLKPFSTEDLLACVEHLIIDYQQANNRFRLVVEAAPNAMVMVDKMGTIVLVNAQTEKLFGYSREELMGKPIDILIPVPYRGVHEDNLTRFFENPKVKPMGKGRDLFGRRKDEAEIPIDVGLNPIEISKELFVLAAIVDITERKQMEQKIREKTALAEHRIAKIRELISKLTLAEQKERYRIAQILHDHLQQLLVAIKFRIGRVSQIITEPMAENNLSEVTGLLEESINTTRTLSIDLSPPILRDAGLVAALEWLSRWKMEKYGLEVFIHTDTQIENLSEDIKITLFQAIGELLFNVYKHAETHQACIRINQQENEYHIMVEDQGRGFDPIILSQSHSTHFGLFHIRERLELLGCNMKIESTPGKGTRCTVHIPFEESPPGGKYSDFEIVCLPEETPNSLVSTGGEKMRLLIVDDHAILRQCLLFALQDHPQLEVVGEAVDGQDAVEKAINLKPDVIIMDISMPRMTGIEATSKIKAIMQDIRIIGLSLHEADDVAQRMLEAGASAYHCKSEPVDNLICSILKFHISRC